MEARKDAAIRAKRQAVAVGILLASLSGGVCFAQASLTQGESAQGFGQLKWGDSLERAMEVYGDLSFGRYAIDDSKEEASKVYVRRTEPGRIDSVAFDSIEYWFRKDRFYKLRAVIHSKIGPRTLVTRAEDAYDRLSTGLSGRYGKPGSVDVRYVTESFAVVKAATWRIDHSSIRLTYEGPRETNDDHLTYEMGRGGP